MQNSERGSVIDAQLEYEACRPKWPSLAEIAIKILSEETFYGIRNNKNNRDRELSDKSTSK